MGVPTSYCPPLLLEEEGVTSGHPRDYSPPIAAYRIEGAGISEAEVGISEAEVAISRAEIGEVVRRMARRLMEQEAAARKKKSKKRDAEQLEPAEEDVVMGALTAGDEIARADSLRSADLTVGLRLLGAVGEVSSSKLTIQLPCQLVGTVSPSEVSDELHAALSSGALGVGVGLGLGVGQLRSARGRGRGRAAQER